MCTSPLLISIVISYLAVLVVSKSGSVQFFECFGRTMNATDGPVHANWVNLELNHRFGSKCSPVPVLWCLNSEPNRVSPKWNEIYCLHCLYILHCSTKLSRAIHEGSRCWVAWDSWERAHFRKRLWESERIGRFPSRLSCLDNWSLWYESTLWGCRGNK